MWNSDRSELPKSVIVKVCPMWFGMLILSKKKFSMKTVYFPTRVVGFYSQTRSRNADKKLEVNFCGLRILTNFS